MKKDLKTLLIRLLNNKITVMSWGITGVKILDDSITFEVNGFKYAGSVEISTYKNEYKICLNDCVYYKVLDEVIETIDNEIEHTGNYISDIEHLINNNL